MSELAESTHRFSEIPRFVHAGRAQAFQWGRVDQSITFAENNFIPMLSTSITLLERACWETIVEDRPAADVAGELGMTVNAVYLARARVLRHLRT